MNPTSYIWVFKVWNLDAKGKYFMQSACCVVRVEQQKACMDYDTEIVYELVAS